MCLPEMMDDYNRLMTDHHKEILTRNFDMLADTLDPKDVVEHLRQDDIINDDEYEELAATHKDTRKSRVRKLVEKLIRKSDFAFFSFVTALKEKCSHIFCACESCIDSRVNKSY